jgi:DNA helicase II / ATP-dependent DNA helicase PcrA
VDSRLDPSQSAVASVTPQERQIVIAGPGAGKSHVVGALAENLVESGVYPEEILVLSFSRIAVDVVRERTQNVVDQGQGVDLATVDSLAARIRRELEAEDPVFLSYEHNIRRATELLPDTEKPVLADIRHLVVDEVQDLVGARARFMIALLQHGIGADCGFTLLGDPLQSLYDFQIGKKDPLDNETFLEEVRTRFGPVERELTGEYRARSPETALPSAKRCELANAASVNRRAVLEALVADLPPLGDFDQDAVDDIIGWPGRTALLCDTNIRSLLVAGAAARHGLVVKLGTDRTDPVLPAWIAELLSDVTKVCLDRPGFLALAADRGLENAEEKWRLLTMLTDARGSLDLSRLAGALMSETRGRRPTDESSVRVVATTVHRAKGAEFDNVVLIDPDSWFQDDDPDPSSRRLFVALTRGRSRLTRANGIKTRGWRKQRVPGGRCVWVKRPRGRRGGAVEIGLEAACARALGPVPHHLSGLVGAEVEWDRTDDLIDVDGHALPSWTASVDGVQVARTGEDLGAVIRRCAFRCSSMPSLAGGRVEGLETVVGPTRDNGPGRHGFWLGARVVGSLHLDWTVRTA